MIYTIKILLPYNIDSDEVLYSIETLLTDSNFKVSRNNNKLNFERLTSKKGAQKFQILTELFKSLPTGEVYIATDLQKELICKINYFKHLSISLILGLLISVLFSLYSENFIRLFLWIGLPFTIIYTIIGILKGNSQIEKLLRKAIG